MGLFVFLGRVIGLSWRFIRATFPYAVQVVKEIAGVMAVTIIATVKGWLPSARAMADKWTRDFMDKRILPQTHDQYVWWFFYCVAILTLVVGWVLLSYVTVWILGAIF